MIMNSKRKEDQAAELREILDQQQSEEIETKKGNAKQEIDILNLPPRSEVHTEIGKARMKVSKPLIRFLFVLFLLTLITLLAYYYLEDEMYFSQFYPLLQRG